MAGLDLKKGNQLFTAEPSGTVTQNGAAVGTWTTNAKNQIVLTKNDKSQVSFDVVWQFNADNHLVASSGAGEFDFNTVADNRVFYQLRDDVLQVQPLQGGTFLFELQGDWTLKPDHNLAFTINGQESVLNGFVGDQSSRFIFHFADKKKPLNISLLGFKGAWDPKPEQDANGRVFLKFNYQRRNRPDGTFRLPQGIGFNTTTNQLLYEYKKDGQVRRIQFVGALLINENFQITYGLERQTSSDGTQMVGSTTFVFNAIYNKKNFTGSLDLALTKPSGGAGATTFSISGNFTAVRGNVTLRAGFTYRQTTAAGPLGPQMVRTFGFNTQLVHKNGKVQVVFLTTNAATKSIELSIGADIRLGDANIDSSLNLKLENGQVVGVKFMLGVTI